MAIDIHEIPEGSQVIERVHLEDDWEDIVNFEHNSSSSGGIRQCYFYKFDTVIFSEI